MNAGVDSEPQSVAEPRSRRLAAATGGPILIVGAVAVLMRGFLGGRLSTQHPDILAYWLPTYCALGKGLAAGHVPAWNPFVMGGAPFAADPQSGWLYAPAMALFSALPCANAMGLMIALQPMLAGLGIFAFARSEGLSRPAATVGGLAMALPLAGSRLGLFLPFPASLAWTAVLLAVASRAVRSTAWPGRVGWATAAGLAWGQLAGAHAGHGLIIGTGALVAYLLAVTVTNVREGTWAVREALLVPALVVLAIVVLSPGILVPRLAYLSRSSYSTGYARLAQLNGRDPDWPLLLATVPGLYLGAFPLVLAFAAIRLRRARALVVGFGAFGIVTYLLSLRPIAHPLARRLSSVPVLDFYQHYPGRLALGLLLVLPILGAVGVDAVLSIPGLRSRLAAALPGVAVWLLLPLLEGIAPADLGLLVAGIAVGGAALAVVGRRPALAGLVPVVLAVELVTNGALGQSGHGSSAVAGSPDDKVWFESLRRPTVAGAAYLRPDAIVQAMQAARSADGPARFVSLDPALVSTRGYLTHQDPRSWGLLANQRSMLFGLEDAQGYNPFQEERYWLFVRQAAAGHVLDYNAAVFPDPAPAVLDLLQVRWVVGPSRRPPLPGLTPVVREGRWTLYALPDPSPRVQLVGAWTVVPDASGARSAVLSPSFDPSAQVILERDPDLVAGPAGSIAPGRVMLQARTAQALSVDVQTDQPALVLVRIVADPGWHATVDGRAVPVMVADSLVQAVPVPAGHHTVELRYDDPWIGRGVVGSGVGAVLMAALWAWIRLRRWDPDQALNPAA
jgi:Bacterial membrane protein YfhO